MNLEKIAQYEHNLKRDASNPDGCWLWIGALTNKGYSRIARHSSIGDLKAHKVIYELLVAFVPNGLELDHTCKNRACVNPNHLEPVTHAENNRRSSHTKLTIEKVQEIKQKLACGGQILGLSLQYGVSYATIWKIANQRSWEDV